MNRIFLKKLIIICFLISGSIPDSFSQERIFFKHLNADNGLSHNSVYCIHEDKYGYIWIGTRNGLNRYDGSNYKTYLNGDRNFKGNIINFIYEDSDGDLWIGTRDGGLNLYNWEDDVFISCFPAEKLYKSDDIMNVEDLLETERGHFLIGTNGSGLFKFEKATGQITQIDDRNLILANVNSRRIKCFCLEDDRRIWIGTLDGLYLYDPYSQNISRPPFSDAISVILNQQILSLFFNGKETLWAGTTRGLFRIYLTDYSVKEYNERLGYLSSDIIRDIHPFTNDRLLLATDGGGLNILSLLTGSVIVYANDPNDHQSISNNALYDICVDSYGSLWIGNYAGGINFYSPYEKKFNTVRHEINNPNSLSDNNVRSVFQDRNGRIWIGTLNGINLYIPEKNSIINSNTFQVLKSEVILTIAEDDDGLIWVGTFSEGIFLMNPESGIIIKYRNPFDENKSLDRSNIYDIIPAGNNIIWIGTTGGLYRISKETGSLRRYTSLNSDLSSNNIRVMLEGNDGKIWIGTNYGLNLFDPVTEKFEIFYNNPDSSLGLSHNQIISLFKDSGGDIWIGTEGGGTDIFHPDQRDFSYLTIQDGLPSNVINSIAEDGSGKIWIGTNKGLVNYDKITGDIITYTKIDGLQSNEFFPNSLFCCRDGNILAGGPEGFNYFDPDNISQNPVAPKVVFTDLYLYNQPVEIGEENSPLERQFCLTENITLKHYQSNISIHFSSLGFINSDSYHYAYFLEGLEQDWNPFGIQRHATYTNLDPGDYIFRVKAMNNDGKLSTSEARLKITVQPPPWKTWYAFTAYSIAFFTLLLLFRMYTISWVKVKHELDLERKEKEQIEQLNQLKLRFFTNVSHEFKTPLTLIINHLEKLKQGLAGIKNLGMVKEVEKNTKRLLLLINELMDFRKAENDQIRLHVSLNDIVSFVKEITYYFNGLAEKMKINYVFEPSQDKIMIWYDPGKLEKVVFNLIDNAFKFTDCDGFIRVGINQNAQGYTGFQKKFKDKLKKKTGSEFIEIYVEDSGKGIALAEQKAVFDRFYQVSDQEDLSDYIPGTGIGLAYSKKLVELHKGEITVQSEPGRGSRFTIRLRKGREHLVNDEKVEFRKQNYVQQIDSEVLSSRSVLKEPDIKLFSDLAVSGKPLMLIVEDSADIRDYLSVEFSDEFRIVEAWNGKVALEIARNSLPDIIISDIMMPVMDGINLCRELKNNTLTCHIPVILLTAREGEKNMIEGLETGADAYITKPFNAAILNITVKNLVKSRKELRNKFKGIETIIPDEIVNNKLDHNLMELLISVIEKHIASSELDVNKLSSEIGMSRSVLYRKVKALTGYSIQDFLRIVRLKKAAQILTEGNISISEVAYMVGFTNAKHFSTSFKKLFGKSPTEFRVPYF